MIIKNFNKFINEKYQKSVNDYAVGDSVLIRYSLTGDVTPVKIVDKKSNSYFIVSHKVEGSYLYNAPNHGIKLSEIIGRYKIDDIADQDQQISPKVKPDTSGMIPGWDSFSNDIAF